MIKKPAETLQSSVSSPVLGIAFSCFNNGETAGKCLASCIAQSWKNLVIEAADDGSTDNTVEILMRTSGDDSRVHVLELSHGERGVARKAAIDALREKGCDYLLFIDSDMELASDLCELCLENLAVHPEIGALVIPEIPWSESTNFFTRVKIFERSILNNAGKRIGRFSIEAARFWRFPVYDLSGGISETQIAFEETQPTIRYLDQGGIVRRAVFTGMKHNEGYNTFKAIMDKKRYYFDAMQGTITEERQGFFKALSRWYFFRPVLYRPSNMLRYLRHPVLALAMFYMYFRLSFAAFGAWMRKRKG